MATAAILEEPQQAPPHYETTDGQPYRPDWSNLSKDRVAELREVCTAMDKRDTWGRMIEIIRCTLRRYFFIGIQHPYWNADAGQFQIGPSGDSGFEQDDLNDEELFEEEFNIFTAQGKIFMAVFSQNAAPTRMEPDKPNDSTGDSVKAANEAEKYVEVYQKYNPPKCAQMDVGRLMYTDGRIISVTDYDTDEEKCGLDEEGEPQGAEFTRYFGVLESKCPLIGNFKKWPYLKISVDGDQLAWQDDYPEISELTDTSSKSQNPNNEVARMARIAVSEGIAQCSSDTLAYLGTKDTWWLRKSAFRALDKEKRVFWIGDGKEQKGIAEKGFRATFIGSIFCEGKQISMDEQCKVMHAMPGDGNARPSYSDAVVPIQMEFNDAMGMFSELLHEAIPATMVNITAESMQAFLEQKSKYGRFVPVQPANGLSLGDNVFPEPQIQMPVGFDKWIENLQGPLTQQITGNYPALMGANMEDQKTASAYAQAKASAQGLMAIAWVPYLEFAAGINWQAARLAGKREQEKISAVLSDKDGKTRTVDIDVSVLKRGGFLCKAVTDENFPESHTDKAAKWQMLWTAAEANPQGPSAAIFTEPDNLVAIKDAMGLDITIKGAAARDKQLAEWEMMRGDDLGPVPDMKATQQLAQQKQQQAQQAVDTIAPGTPAPPLPPPPIQMASSVPIRLADDHIEEARTCVRILNDAKTLEMVPTKPEVVKDLELHLIAHLTKAQSSGIMIPPDLLGIIPPLPMPMPGMGAPPPPAAPAPGGPTNAAH